ncbi:hypothetical protein EMIT093MI4_170051 [Pseudomonas sp. IT-93MI4]
MYESIRRLRKKEMQFLTLWLLQNCVIQDFFNTV